MEAPVAGAGGLPECHSAESKVNAPIAASLGGDAIQAKWLINSQTIRESVQVTELTVE